MIIFEVQMVDIIIVNWNSGAALKKCIDSIILSDNIDHTGKIIISDNNSTDGSADSIASHAKVRLIYHDTNLGFAAALNRGIRESTAELLLLLNPDTRLLQGNLAGCLSYLNQHNSIDILGCQLLNDEGETTVSCSRFPGVAGFLVQSLKLYRLAPALFTPPILMTDFDHTRSRKVDQVMGAFMFMRREVIDRAGYFDERFFVYYEDLDFALRLAKLGGVSYFYAEVKAFHSGMGTTKKIPALRLYYNLKSRHQYAKKHFSTAGYLAVKMMTYTTEFCSQLLFLLIKADLAGLKNLLRTYKMLLLPEK
jgi:hypothetical protein